MLIPNLIAAVAVLILFVALDWARRWLPPFELATETVAIDGWTWRYHTSGHGRDVILLHGIGANLYCWRGLIPLLNQDFRLWAVDLPGFGGSSKPKDAAYGLDDQVTRLSLFMNQMKIEKAFVVGNSMGGNIALWLAKNFPARVTAVTVIAPATSPWLVPINVARWAWVAGPMSLLMNRTAIRWAHLRTVSSKDRVDETRVEETYQTYRRHPDAVRSFIRATEAIRDPRLPAALKGLEAKVLLLWGAHDLLVSKKVMDDLEAALAKEKSVVHPGGGHHLQEDDPEWVAKRIVEFFRA